MNTTKPCRQCKQATMTQVETAQDLTVRGVELHVEGLRHWECPNCAAQVETMDQMDYNAEAIQHALAQRRAQYRQANKLMRGEEIRTLRKRFCLTQSLAAALFGGGPVAFSKYESEDTAQSTAMNRLLELALIDDPQNICRLAQRYEVALPANTTEAIGAACAKGEFRRAGVRAYITLADATKGWDFQRPRNDKAANEKLYRKFEPQTSVASFDIPLGMLRAA